MFLAKLTDADKKTWFPDELTRLISKIHKEHNPSRLQLLKKRKDVQAKFDSGELPKFIPSHPAHQSDWKVAPIPKDLLDRRVEITGPVNSAKMVINMLNPNSEGIAADMAMLDFEDSINPTWENILDGIKNVTGALDGTLTFTQPGQGGAPGKTYKLHPTKQAHVMIRVRGLHLIEEHAEVDGEKVSGGLFDLVCTAYHCAKLFKKKGQTPKYYVPKTQSWEEAAWWNSLFRTVEKSLDLQQGELRTTFLIETLPAAFQMEEILYEIRERACSLNVGRWDKIFSDIKTLGKHKDRILANRSYIDMTRPWMENYAKLLVKTCHAHGAFAMGGMAAFTPGKDEALRAQQTKKVELDKIRESQWGHDGCWVSHPYFIGVARAQFKKVNQLDFQTPEFPKNPDLLPRAEGPKTLDGLRTNLRVGIAYQEGWNQGLGCVAIDNLMEDLATLEISRMQTWQWLHHEVKLDDGTKVTKQLIEKICDEEYQKLISEASADQKAQLTTAAKQIKMLFTQTQMFDFFSNFKSSEH